MIQQILQQLDKFIRGDTSQEDFENWFLPATWNLKPKSDAITHDVAAAITLALAEFDSGHLDSSELKQRLREVRSQTQISAAAD